MLLDSALPPAYTQVNITRGISGAVAGLASTAVRSGCGTTAGSNGDGRGGQPMPLGAGARVPSTCRAASDRPSTLEKSPAPPPPRLLQILIPVSASLSPTPTRLVQLVWCVLHVWDDSWSVR